MSRDPTAGGLRAMRRVATGLLIGVSILYVIAHLMERTHPWAAFVRAFAEAAMVGALADWFAVTALFRHPLGIPVPHTAVIPKSKDRIGEGLGRFVEENFLAPQIVAAKIQSADLAGTLARWMMQPENSSMAASGVMRAMSVVANSLTEEDLARLIRKHLLSHVERGEFAPLLGRVLAALMNEHRHKPVVDVLLRKAAELVREYEPQLRDAVHNRTSWLWRRFSMDDRIADSLIVALDETLRAAADNPDHTLRLRIDAELDKLCQQLLLSPHYLAEGERLKHQLLAHPGIDDYLRQVGRALLERFASGATGDSPANAPLARWLHDTADTVLADEPLRAELNLMARATVIRLLELQRLQIAHLIADTVKQWDADTLTSRMEIAIGRDLQYIRVNGTLIGGLVGLVIHIVSTTVL